MPVVITLLCTFCSNILNTENCEIGYYSNYTAKGPGVIVVSQEFCANYDYFNDIWVNALVAIWSWSMVVGTFALFALIYLFGTTAEISKPHARPDVATELVEKTKIIPDEKNIP